MTSNSGKKRGKKRRRSYFVQRTSTPGAAPGTLTADPDAPKPVIQLVAYGPDQYVELDLAEKEIEVVRQYLGKYPVVWLNVDGLGDDRVVAKIGEVLGLHVLALEDVLNPHQRAKVEEYSDYLFITARMIARSEGLDTEQLSMFLGKNYLVTFQELPGDAFDLVRDRIKKGRAAPCKFGPDYLAYTLLDAVIDAFFPALERYGEMLDDLEEQVVTTPDVACITQIHEIKNDLILLRRAIWPQREAINTLLRDSHEMVKPETALHLRDCYDHTVQIIDLVEVYREIASGLTDLYVSSVSNRMNEVMKVLTIIATIFIPLTFITSIYGMNFNTKVSPWNMPELDMRYGYPTIVVIMLAVTVAMMYFFWRKGWLRSLAPDGHRRRRDSRMPTPNDKRVGTPNVAANGAAHNGSPKNGASARSAER